MKINTLLLSITFLISVQVQSQITKLYDFGNTANDGTNPKGDLVADSTYFYGLCSTGGVNGMGIIFKVKHDGSGYMKLYEFSGTDGSFPYGTLVLDSSYLFGITNSGGTTAICTTGCGTVFKIKNDGTGFSTIYEFSSSPDGRYPLGSLIFDGTYLYGTTQYGGAGFGTNYRIMPDGTNYLKLSDYTPSNGSYPYGSLYLVSNYLYGMTFEGGDLNSCPSGCGVVFKMQTDGNGYSKIHEFTGNPTDGDNPQGSFTFDGTYLYGMTSGGGTQNSGIIFRLKTDGTDYLKLFDFVNHDYPYGSLLLDNGYLYGMTWQGGTNAMGTLFRIKTDGTGFIALYNFSNTPDGKNPVGSLTLHDGNIYGMTSNGGINNTGIIFMYQLNTTVTETNNSKSNFHLLSNNITNEIVVTSSAQGEVILYDMTGKVVLEKYIYAGETIFSTEKLLSGVYLLQFNNEKSNNLFKVTKN